MPQTPLTPDEYLAIFYKDLTCSVTNALVTGHLARILEMERAPSTQVSVSQVRKDFVDDLGTEVDYLVTQVMNHCFGADHDLKLNLFLEPDRVTGNHGG